MKQHAFVFDLNQRITHEKAEVIADAVYQLNDNRTFYIDPSAVIEVWHDRLWGFSNGLPKVTYEVMLSRGHGLPLQPWYGPAHGWRGPDPDSTRAVAMAARAHEETNSKTAVDAIGGSKAGFTWIQRPIDIVALTMLIPVLVLIALNAYRIMTQ